MAALPVDDVWGGAAHQKKLAAMGIKTVLELADTDIRLSGNTSMSCWREQSGSCAASHV
jgi:nucleotidyltransferase/DNA polymerase involved in DNA repair